MEEIKKTRVRKPKEIVSAAEIGPEPKVHTVSQMPKFKPKSAQLHVPQGFAENNSGNVYGSVGTKPEHAGIEMMLHPAGMLFRYANSKKGKLIPYANIQGIDVEFEE